jgi:hypothetical protein
LQKIVNEGEVEYLQKPVALTTHNRCLHFDDEYAHQTGHQIDSYALAIGGMHASDADVLLDGVIADKTPRTLIYLMAPRDVLDNILETPTATDTFQLVSRISDLSAVKARCRHSFKEIFVGAIEDAVKKLSPLSEYHVELQTLATRAWVDSYTPYLRERVPARPYDAKAMGLKEDPFDLPADAYLSPGTANLNKRSDNYMCYACTYQPFRPRPYNLQFDFLKRMLTSARERNIDVILVNMPLRSDNLKAMMPGFYDLYRKNVMATAKQYGAHYVDMFDLNRYKFDDFTDTVHLSGKGCGKFVVELTAKISPVVLASTTAKPQMAYREKASF